MHFTITPHNLFSHIALSIPAWMVTRYLFFVSVLPYLTGPSILFFDSSHPVVECGSLIFQQISWCPVVQCSSMLHFSIRSLGLPQTTSSKQGNCLPIEQNRWVSWIHQKKSKSSDVASGPSHRAKFLESVSDIVDQMVDAKNYGELLCHIQVDLFMDV